MPRAKLFLALSVVFLLGALTPYLARTAEEKPREIPALKVAYVDMDKLFTQYKPYQMALERMKQETKELVEKFQGEHKSFNELEEALKKIPEGSVEHKTKASELGKMELDIKFRLTDISKKIEAKFGHARFTTFERIEKISHRICDQYDIGLLLRHNTLTINPRDQKEVLRAINGNIVHADPRLDLTSLILFELEKLPPLDQP